MTQFHALIVDDNSQNLKVLAQLLARQGLTCTEVSDPRTLSSIIAPLDAPSVAFVDIEMDGLDGFQTKDLLKRVYPTMPVVAYTVHVSEINAVREAGFDGFLGKPLDNERFPNQLARILRGEGVWERA